MRTYKLAVALAALGLCLTPALFAQDEDLSTLFADETVDSGTAVTAAATESAFTLRLSGDHGFAYRAPAYWEDGNMNYDGVKAPSFTNDFGAEVKDGNVKLVSHWEFGASPLGYDAQNPNSNWAESVTIKPLENYASWSPANLKFSAGYQIFAWGVADRKNPTDNLNAKDYTVGVSPDKIPVLAADAVWYPTDSVSVEGVFIPSRQASQYPEDFANILRTKNFTGIASYDIDKITYAPIAPVATTYSVDSIGYDRAGSKPKDFVAGGKVNFNSALFDLSLDYLYDLDQYYTPKITTVAEPFNASVNGTVIAKPAGTYYKVSSIVLEQKRVQRFGGDAKTTIGKFGLWLEGAYSLTENDGDDDYSVRKSRIDYTLGSDVSYGPNDTVYTNVQYFGTWIPGFDDDFSLAENAGMIASTQADAEEFYQRAMVNMLGLETEGLLQGLTCNVKAELADALFTPQVTAVYAMPFQYDDSEETRYGALALNPELDIKPVDSFHVKIGADLYYAWHKVKGDDGVTLDTTTNAIGTYTPSNNVYLKVEYKWNADVKK